MLWKSNAQQIFSEEKLHTEESVLIFVISKFSMPNFMKKIFLLMIPDSDDGFLLS